MANISVDARIKFEESIAVLGKSGSISWQIFGGAIARIFAGIFDENDVALQGVGFGTFGQPLTTEIGQVSWLFGMTEKASYLKWGVQAVRSGGSLGPYSATAKVRDAFGKVLAVGQFSATIPDNQFEDDIIFDGVNLSHSINEAVLGGKDI